MEHDAQMIAGWHMAKFIKTTILILVVLIGGFALYHRNEIRSVEDFFQIARDEVSTIKVGFSSANPSPAFTTYRRPLDRIRLCTFKLNPFFNLEFTPHASRRLAEICRQFDIIAFQQFGPQNPSAVAEFLVMLNRDGANYRHFAEPTGNGLAFGFDANRIELVDSRCYTVNDPDNLFSYKPFVAWFRVNRTAPEQAFTFTVANIQTRAEQPEIELAYLGELFRAVRADGRGEDDVLIVGDFNSGVENLRPLDQRHGLTWVVSNLPTNTLQTGQFDNIIFNPNATVEFTGNSGVFDFLKQFNLSLNDAMQLSARIPVWAEFAMHEGQRLEEAAPLPPSNQAFPVEDLPSRIPPVQKSRPPVDLQAGKTEQGESSIQHFQLAPASRYRQVGTKQ